MNLQLGFTMPADKLDKGGRSTYVTNLNRALDLITGHFDSAWMIDHLQFGDADVLEGFTALTYMAALHPRLKFGHTVLCPSFRNPALLAKMGATLHITVLLLPCAVTEYGLPPCQVALSP